MAKKDDDNAMMKLMETMMKTMFMGPIYVMKAVTDLLDKDEEEKPAKKSKPAATVPAETEQSAASQKPSTATPRGWGPITPQDPNVFGWGEM